MVEKEELKHNYFLHMIGYTENLREIQINYKN